MTKKTELQKLVEEQEALELRKETLKLGVIEKFLTKSNNSKDIQQVGSLALDAANSLPPGPEQELLNNIATVIQTGFTALKAKVDQAAIVEVPMEEIHPEEVKA